MDEEAVFKRYDIRGKFPEEIDEEFALRLGKSFGTFIKEEGGEKVVLTRDTKESSSVLKDKISEGLRETGVAVLNAGKGPTDFTAFSGNRKSCFSVQVTSSHLPLDFNGFKFMYPEGNGLVNEDLDRIKKIFRDQSFSSGKGSEKDISEKAAEKYRKGIKEFFHRYFDSLNKTIVLEHMGGASSVFLPDLMEELGAEVKDLSSGEDEPCIDPPNPDPENLEHLEKAFKEHDADIGLALDMDGDRAKIYRESGWVEGNQLIAVLADLLKPDKMVVSIDSSRTVEEMAEKTGTEISYTRVGDPFVISKTLEINAEFSAEPNGHYCFSGFVPYNSGILAGILGSAADFTVINELEDRKIKKDSVKVRKKHRIIDDLKREIGERYEKVSTVDGIKFRSDSGLLLVRPSGSSPKLRIVADAETEKKAEELVETVKELIRNK